VIEERANLAVRALCAHNWLSFSESTHARHARMIQKDETAGEKRQYEQGILSVMLGKDEDGSSMPLPRVVDNIKTFLYDRLLTLHTNAAHARAHWRRWHTALPDTTRPRHCCRSPSA
jgi:hypothetical protein